MADPTLSKADFAKLCNVDPSRVSHWIRDGRISGDAIVGEGRKSRVVVVVAQRQLRSRLDPYQMMGTGNGGGTKLNAKPPGPPDADGLWWILQQTPALVAWDLAGPDVSLQACFDAFANLRLNITGEITSCLKAAVPGPFKDVDWRGLAKEYGIPFVEPRAMHADWNRRRLADD